MLLRNLLFTVLLLFFGNSFNGYSQCTTTINTFPYQESFETGTANWVSGGLNNDWAWGSPSKPTISSAGAGINCWITGGLTTSFYSLGQRSWVESPCFDFTALSNPYISFLIFWDLERTYDGGNFQYTLDGGLTWRNVGAYNDPNQCNRQNWFNISSILNLNSMVNNSAGWSGTIQPGGAGCSGGNGSNGWVLATHCLNEMANQPQVKFRFTFGAGTTCNNYDGLAFDDVFIGSAPSSSTDFTFSCTGGQTIQFTSAASACFTSWNWNFGDTVSNTNSSTSANPVHTFSTGGNYSVTLNASSGCVDDTTIVKQVKLLSLDYNVSPVSCEGLTDGSASVTAINGSPGISYSWSHDPGLNSSSAFQLPVGNYTVTATDPGSCSRAVAINVAYGPDAFPEVSLGPDTVFCPGSLSVLYPGSFISYHWQDNSTDSVFTVSSEGIYAVRITNASGCSASDTVTFEFDCLGDLLLPNAFSPNGDGLNELFIPVGSRTTSFSFLIFSRWGELIYSSEDLDEGWDGTLKGNEVQEGFYNYLLSYRIGSIEKTKKGSVYLFR